MLVAGGSDYACDPPVHVEVKRHPLNVRTTRRIRDLIENDAQASGRSMSGQLEWLIERHYDREALLADLLAIVRQMK